MDGEFVRELAIDVKSSNEDLEDMCFDGFYAQWMEDDQIQQWTESIALV